MARRWWRARLKFPVRLFLLLQDAAGSHRVLDLRVGESRGRLHLALAVLDGGKHLVRGQLPDVRIGDRLYPRRLSHPDRKSTRLNSSHLAISYAVFCLKKKK